MRMNNPKPSTAGATDRSLPPEKRHGCDDDKGEVATSNPEQDAIGQFAPSQADRNASGVISAKPTVITGSEDATVHRDPPGKNSGKDFDPNYDPTGRNKAPEAGGE